MGSRYIKHEPGDEVPVEVEADTNGDMATAGDLVQVRGENTEFTTVEQNDAADGKAIGMLATDGRDYDSSTSYSSGDSAGEATLYLFHPVLWLDPTSGYSSPSAGDLVQEADAGDVQAYTGATATSVGTLTNTLGHDGSGVLETDAGSDTDVNLADAVPFGQVFSTRVRSLHVGDRVAVVKYR